MRYLSDAQMSHIEGLFAEGGTLTAIMRLYPGCTHEQLSSIRRRIELAQALPPESSPLSAFDGTYSFTEHYTPRASRCVAVLPGTMPGSSIKAPTRAQLMAGR